VRFDRKDEISDDSAARKGARENETKGKKTHDRRSNEPPRVADRVEEGECLLHSVLEEGDEREARVSERKQGERGKKGRGTYDRLILVQSHVVLGDSDEEDDGGDVLEAVDPDFKEEEDGSLSANVERRKVEKTKPNATSETHHFFLSDLCPPTSNNL